MTGNAWIWIGGVSAIWIALGYYILFLRANGRMALIPVKVIPKDDSEVIVSNSKIMISVLFAQEEKEQATPALLADFVISFKDIVNGSYKAPISSASLVQPETSKTIEASGPEKKDEGDSDSPGLPDHEIPDLSDEPELPEIDTDNIPDRGPEIVPVYDESQLVDSNTLNLNMLNPN